MQRHLAAFEPDLVIAARARALALDAAAARLAETGRAAEGKQHLLEFWLTTEEEGYQIVPTTEADALVAYLMALKKAEVPLPEAKE